MEDFIQYLIEQTGPVAVAVMALYFMQQNHQAYMKREADNTNIHREDKVRMFSVIEANTASNARLIVLIERSNIALKAITDSGDD
jgi:hypothetical protein